MAFHGGRCPRAEMCIQFWGAEVRLDDKSQAPGGPTWDKEGRRSAGQLQSHQWWVDVRPAPMGYFLSLFCGCLSYFLWLCELSEQEWRQAGQEHTEGFSVRRTGQAF